MESTLQRFHEDHVRLSGIFQDLLNAVDSDDSPTIQRSWSTFERGILTHLDAEEELMLPRLQKQHAGEVARILREHERIRDLVDAVGIQTELHLLRKDTAEDLVNLLREHAAREDATIYKWADEELDGGLLAELRAVITGQSKRKPFFHRVTA